MPNKQKKKRHTEPYLLVSPTLMYGEEEYIVTPGRKVNLIDGMYVQYTVVEVELNRKPNCTDKSKWSVSILGDGNTKFKLPSLNTARSKFLDCYSELIHHKDKLLSSNSRIVRADVSKFGGVGLDYGSVSGWDSSCKSHSPPITVGEIIPWFTGYDLSPKDSSSQPDPRHVNNDTGSLYLNVYNDLFRNCHLDMENRMAQISGVEFLSNRGSRPSYYKAPCFLYHALPDYADEFNLSVDSVLNFLKNQECNGKRATIWNPRRQSIMANVGTLTRDLSLKDGKLLKNKAKNLLSPDIYWVPCAKLEHLDATAIRMCVNMQSVSV